jgi:hypothetical protein
LPQPGEIIAGKYLVTGLIGRGGMGAVYVVEHRVTRKRLAVKCLLPEHSEQPELVERFLREAQAAGRIQHRYVVDVFDVGQDDGLLYIVMELIDGKQLGDVLRDARLPAEDLLLFSAHHSVVDFAALGSIARDLATLWRGGSLAPAAAESGYPAWVRFQRELVAGPAGERLRAFWRERLAAGVPDLDLPADRPRPPAQTFRGTVATAALPPARPSRRAR